MARFGVGASDLRVLSCAPARRVNVNSVQLPRLTLNTPVASRFPSRAIKTIPRLTSISGMSCQNSGRADTTSVASPFSITTGLDLDGVFAIALSRLHGIARR